MCHMRRRMRWMKGCMERASVSAWSSFTALLWEFLQTFGVLFFYFTTDTRTII